MHETSKAIYQCGNYAILLISQLPQSSHEHIHYFALARSVLVSWPFKYAFGSCLSLLFLMGYATCTLVSHFLDVILICYLIIPFLTNQFSLMDVLFILELQGNGLLLFGKYYFRILLAEEFSWKGMSFSSYSTSHCLCLLFFFAGANIDT